jgi:hypothetical protein
MRALVGIQGELLNVIGDACRCHYRAEYEPLKLGLRGVLLR